MLASPRTPTARTRNLFVRVTRLPASIIRVVLVVTFCVQDGSDVGSSIEMNRFHEIDSNSWNEDEIANVRSTKKTNTRHARLPSMTLAFRRICTRFENL